MAIDVCRDAGRTSSHGNCDSVPSVGRSLRASLAFTAALGLSGCLLFTDPINKAPTVTIYQPTDPVVRGIPAKFTARPDDDKDSQSSLQLEWAEFKAQPQGCGWITTATWDSRYKATTLDSFETYTLTAESVDRICVCARTTDHNGATGIGCSTAITPANAAPVARIVDVSGDPSGQQRPLCSPMHLSAETSDFLDGDQFNWSIQYTGSDPSAKQPQLASCSGIEAKKDTQHRCFYAGSPGTYKVTLTIIDTYAVNGVPTSLSSAPAIFDIPVDVDRPPCLQRTDPDVHAQRILLSRSTDLGGTYQSRTFKVLSVADDCEPYPLPVGSMNEPTQFVWSVLDSTRASATWTYQTNTSDAFTISQAQFPNARPGDTIRVRVEVRDTAVQKLYQAGGSVCAQDTVDICCGSAACGTPNDCVRWTSWTVQFQP